MRINSQAQEIIKAARSIYPDGKVPIGQKPPPPSPILADLQEQNDVAVELGRDKLKQALGESTFTNFDGFVRGFMGRNVKIENIPERARPENHGKILTK